MIGTKNRFRGQNDIKRIYRNGSIVRGDVIELRYVDGNRQNSYRATVVVSKKVSKSAVVRNRIRRRVYEAIRQLSEQIQSNPDLLFTVHKEELAGMPYPQVLLLTGNLLKKAKLL